MRLFMVVLASCGILIGSAAVPVAAIAAGSDHSEVAAQQPPAAQLEVDIDTDRGGAWYTSPVWIAIGVLALVLLIVLIVMATRGGGTTIVRE